MIVEFCVPELPRPDSNHVVAATKRGRPCGCCHGHDGSGETIFEVLKLRPSLVIDSTGPNQHVLPPPHPSGPHCTKNCTNFWEKLVLCRSRTVRRGHSASGKQAWGSRNLLGTRGPHCPTTNHDPRTPCRGTCGGGHLDRVGHTGKHGWKKVKGATFDEGATTGARLCGSNVVCGAIGQHVNGTLVVGPLCDATRVVGPRAFNGSCIRACVATCCHWCSGVDGSSSSGVAFGRSLPASFSQKGATNLRPPEPDHVGPWVVDSQRAHHGGCNVGGLWIISGIGCVSGTLRAQEIQPAKGQVQTGAQALRPPKGRDRLWLNSANRSGLNRSCVFGQIGLNMSDLFWSDLFRSDLPR